VRRGGADHVKLVKALNPSRAFPLPKQMLTEITGIMGITGSGKTYAGGRLVEELYRLRAQFVVLEPVGNWWGLRLRADGEGKGIDVPIFGGDHGDLPLPETSGAEVARLLVEQKLSAILDVSGFRKRAMRRFTADFAETFFHLKKSHKSPVCVVVEEARVFVPQKINKGDEGAARLLGAMEDIGRRGRNYGIGMALLDQRPQSVHKDVLNQAQNLIVLQLAGKHETDAVAAWVREKARADKDAQWWEELAALPPGEAFIWSPRRHIFDHVKVTKKWTYDSTKTPDFDDDTPAPTLSEIDVGAIKVALEATIEKAKKTDPKELTRKIKTQAKEIARLNRELATKPAEVTTQEVEVEVPVSVVSPEDLRAARDRVHQIMAVRTDIDGKLGELGQLAVGLENLAKDAFKIVDDGIARIEELQRGEPGKKKREEKKHVRVPPSVPAKKTARPAEMSKLNGEVTESHRRLLDALAKLEAIGHEVATNHQIGFVAGYKISGRFHNLRGELRKLGLVEYVPGGTQLTDDGRALAEVPDVPLTTDALQETVFSMITSSQRKLLEALIHVYPEPLTNEELGEVTGYRLSGRFHNLRGELKTMGFVDYPAGAHTAASSMLFLED
jgi:multidrug efflux pump subunit AcrA (membrane-fusion protein)